MKILIDIGHPGHVHLFRPFAMKMQKKGHQILFTCREKEFEKYLLNKYGFTYKSFGKKYNSIFAKIFALVKFDFLEFLQGLRFKPDVFLSHGSIYAAHAAFLLRKPHIALEDTGNREQVRLYLPLTEAVLTSDVFPFDYGAKQIRYTGHHELAYLHPNYFKPVKDIRSDIGFKEHEKIALVRFIAWNASHDFHKKGLSLKEKLQIINALEKVNYKIIISSEDTLPIELKKYKATFSPEKIHDVLYTSDLFIGEGTTMAMEAAILGTPSIYINPLQYSNCDDLERYGLLFSYKTFDGILDRIDELVKLPNSNIEFQTRRDLMLAEKIDVTSFIVWFVENYPKSVELARKADEEFWRRFK